MENKDATDPVDALIVFVIKSSVDDELKKRLFFEINMWRAQQKGKALAFFHGTDYCSRLDFSGQRMGFPECTCDK